jgi:hypothetical protein
MFIMCSYPQPYPTLQSICPENRLKDPSTLLSRPLPLLAWKGLSESCVRSFFSSCHVPCVMMIYSCTHSGPSSQPLFRLRPVKGISRWGVGRYGENVKGWEMKLNKALLSLPWQLWPVSVRSDPRQLYSQHRDLTVLQQTLSLLHNSHSSAITVAQETLWSCIGSLFICFQCYALWSCIKYM